ncbi:MAG: GAF domain-containing sensor histidine kinase [Chloroflexota bacterium]
MTVLEQLKDISTAVMYAAEANELESVLQRIADVARQLVKTKYAALGIPNGQGGLRYFKTSGMTVEAEARIAHRPFGHGLIGAIMSERKVIRLNNMADDSRSFGFPDNHPQMSSFLGAPIIVANHLYGMLYLSDKANGSVFTDEDETLVEALAGYAALAIAGAQLSENASRFKLLEQRENIGMELHDGVIQSLYGIGMQVDLLRRSGADVGEEHLSDLVNNLNDVIEEIRGFIGKLRSKRDTLTIRENIHRLRERLHPPQNIVIEIDAPDTLAPFSPTAFESICLIINEAMSNAIRHADAKIIRVIADVSDGFFKVQVIDNGTGFNHKMLDHSTGLGLRNMQQRAYLYNGRVTIDSNPEEGTTIDIVIPVGAY